MLENIRFREAKKAPLPQLFARGAHFAAMQIDSLSILSEETALLVAYDSGPIRPIYPIFISTIRSSLELSTITNYIISTNASSHQLLS